MVLSNLISNTLKIIIMNALWLEKCVIIGVKVLEFCDMMLNLFVFFVQNVIFSLCFSCILYENMHFTNNSFLFYSS